MNADVKGESEPPHPWECEEARGEFFGGHPPPPRHRQGEQHEAAEAEKGTNADFEPNVSVWFSGGTYPAPGDEAEDAETRGGAFEAVLEHQNWLLWALSKIIKLIIYCDLVYFFCKCYCVPLFFYYHLNLPNAIVRQESRKSKQSVSGGARSWRRVWSSLLSLSFTGNLIPALFLLDWAIHAMLEADVRAWKGLFLKYTMCTYMSTYLRYVKVSGTGLWLTDYI